MIRNSVRTWSPSAAHREELGEHALLVVGVDEVETVLADKLSGPDADQVVADGARPTDRAVGVEEQRGVAGSRHDRALAGIGRPQLGE